MSTSRASDHIAYPSSFALGTLPLPGLDLVLPGRGKTMRRLRPPRFAHDSRRVRTSIPKGAQVRSGVIALLIVSSLSSVNASAEPSGGDSLAGFHLADDVQHSVLGPSPDSREDDIVPPQRREDTPSMENDRSPMAITVGLGPASSAAQRTRVIPIFSPASPPTRRSTRLRCETRSERPASGSLAVGIGIGLAGALAVSGWSWLRLRRRRHARDDPRPRFLAWRRAVREVMRAAQGSDAQTLQRALLALGDLAWPSTPPRNLDTLAACLDDPTARELLHRIDRRAYGRTPDVTTGRADGEPHLDSLEEIGSEPTDLPNVSPVLSKTDTTRLISAIESARVPTS